METKNENTEGQGVFAVRLSMVDGKVAAVLTGDHFNHEDIYPGSDADMLFNSSYGMEKHDSPTYPVPDNIVRMAVSAMHRVVLSGMSECHNGDNGSACGDCAVCNAAKRDAFTMTILWKLGLPRTDLSRRMVDAVSSAIGMVCVDVPWEDEAMSGKDMKKIMDELSQLGLCLDKQQGRME